MRAANHTIFWLLGAAALVGGFSVALGSYEEEFATPFAHRTSDWSSANACRACHPDHHASWARTFHRTMTQEATDASVRGAFDGREVTLWGVTARPTRDGDAFVMEYLDGPGGRVVRKLPILRTVGSRRYQQYLTQDPGTTGENYYRIPLLWHIGEARWIHLNGAFLGHDRADYDQHLTMWNQNCIFCHNTGARPGATNLAELEERRRRGEQVSAEWDGRYASSVSELGIACESCHGPGAEHGHRNRDPLRRYALHLGGHADPTIVNPDRLDPARSAQVCGQCHGARIPKRENAILEWLVDGHPYRAGEDLHDHVDLIWRDTVPPGGKPDDDLFRLRFWEDGTPRLTAYEYQGLLMSPCYQKGKLTCTSCHSMHGGDIHGQITAEKRSNAACTVCHEDIGRDVSAHTHHKADGSGSSCYDCHMPRMVYGVLEIHRSHRIENPDPARDVATARPNACTSCHTDQSPQWAARAMREWWGDRYQDPAPRRDAAPVDVPDFLRQLHAGDPAQRAVAARLAGRADSPLDDARRLVLVPHLLVALHDPYPAVRWFARKSLMELAEQLGGAAALAAGVRDFDYIRDPRPRGDAATALMNLWRGETIGRATAPPPAFMLDQKWNPLREPIASLLRLQASKVIRIGE